jgi:hypothetical protein
VLHGGHGGYWAVLGYIDCTKGSRALQVFLVWLVWYTCPLIVYLTKHPSMALDPSMTSVYHAG